MAPKGDLWFIVEPRLTKAGSWLNYRDSRGNRRSLTTAHPEGETGWTQLEPPPTNISPTFLDQQLALFPLYVPDNFWKLLKEEADDLPPKN